jgi:hypothetical protein
VLGVLVVLVRNGITAYPSLLVDVNEPKTTGQKADIRLDLNNTFGAGIQSAQATVFLVDANGKVIGEMTKWIIGGTTNRPILAPGKSATYHFVADQRRPFSSIKITVNRIVLEGGKLADVTKDVIVNGTEQKQKNQ